MSTAQKNPSDMDLSGFGALLAEIHHAPDQEHTVDRVVATAVQVIDCGGAGLMLVRAGGQVETAAFSDDTVEQAEVLQLALKEGPCLSAIAAATHFRVSDTATDDRWPRWCAAVAVLGVHSIVSVCVLSPDHRVLGSLLTYATRIDAFDAEDEAIALALGTNAAVAVQRNRHEAALARAVDGRTLIGQAMGLVMERYGVDADRAFAVLTRFSQQQNVKVREVARHVVETRLLPQVPS
jgi:GAF domain-containing protein